MYMESPWSEILKLMGKPVNFTGAIQIRMNRGMVDDPAVLPRPSKKKLVAIFKKIIPDPFQWTTTSDIAKKYRLEWFRIQLDFNQGKLSEALYEFPIEKGRWSVRRFDDKGIRQRIQERPNAARHII